jgi:hypothetical protein
MKVPAWELRKFLGISDVAFIKVNQPLAIGPDGPSKRQPDNWWAPADLDQGLGCPLSA